MTGSLAERLYRSGDALLVGALVLGALVLLALVAQNAPPALFFAVPGAAVGALAAVFVAQRPRVNYALVIGLSVLTIGFQKGIQMGEVLYGLYYLGYLAGWFALRVFVYRESLTAYAGDRAMLAFIIGIVLSTLWAFPFGAAGDEYVSNMSALAFFAFYFPVREACMRWNDGVRFTLLLVLFVALYVAVRNFTLYEELITQAVLADFVRNRRVSMNDNVLMAGAVLTMVLLSAATRWRERAFLAVSVCLLVGALVITLSRAQWVVTAFGFGLAVLLGRGRQRLQALGWIAGGTVLVSLLMFVLAGDKLAVILEGITSRFSSLSSSTSRDLSLISRFYEARSALGRIRLNPVLGYGPGVYYEHFDIILQVTSRRTLVHNGYVSLWYRFGLWGVVLLGMAWVGAIRRGLAVRRLAAATGLEKAVGFGCALALVCYFLSTITANPFHNSDGIFFFALLSGTISGTYARVMQREATLLVLPAS